MKLSLSSFFSIFKQALSGWQKDNATVWAAALAYYTLFSIGPLLLIIISVAGLFISQQTFENTILKQMEELIGADGARIFENVISQSNKTQAGIIGIVTGTLSLILGAIGVFGQLQQMLNKVWGVTQHPKSGIFPLIRSRLLSLSLVGVIAFLLLVSLIASTSITYLGTYLRNLLPFSPFLLEVLNFAISFFAISVLFGFILKVLPDVKLKWKMVWLGAIVTSFLFTVGKTLIGIYIGNSGVASSYGAAGAVIVLLLWVYYTSQIVFFGAEFTKAYSLHKGYKILPNQYSILSAQKEKEEKEKGKKFEEKVATGFVEGFLSSLFKPTNLNSKRR